MDRIFLKKPEPGDSLLIRMTARQSSIYCYPYVIYELLIWLNWLFLIQSRGEIVGYVCYLPFKFLESVFLLQLAITPEHQSRKIGSAVLGKILYILKRRHRIKRIYLHTLKIRVRDWMKRQKYKVLFSVSSIWVMYKVNRNKVGERIKNRRIHRKEQYKKSVPYF